MKVDQWNESAPYAIEGSTANATTPATAVANGASDANLVTNISTLCAKELNLMVVTDQAITITIRKYAIGKLIYKDTASAVGANTFSTADLIQDTSGFGQCLDILVSNASGSTATVFCWVVAKN